MAWAFNCDRCGRFTNPEAPGVSFSRTWYEDGYGGCLRDPEYRCSPCTDKHGIGRTNCAPSYGGNGRNPPAETSLSGSEQDDERTETREETKTSIPHPPSEKEAEGGS